MASPVSISVKTEQSGPTETVEVNDTDIPTSCAHQLLAKDEDKEDINDASSFENLSKTNVSFSSVSNNYVNKDIKNVALDSFKNYGEVAFNSNLNRPVFEKFKPRKVVKESDKCKCVCGNCFKQDSFGLGPSSNNTFLKNRFVLIVVLQVTLLETIHIIHMLLSLNLDGRTCQGQDLPKEILRGQIPSITIGMMTRPRLRPSMTKRKLTREMA